MSRSRAWVRTHDEHREQITLGHERLKTLIL